MFALIVKMVQSVKPEKQAAEMRWPQPQPQEPMPKCVEEYHNWRWSI